MAGLQVWRKWQTQSQDLLTETPHNNHNEDCNGKCSIIRHYHHDTNSSKYHSFEHHSKLTHHTNDWNKKLILSDTHFWVRSIKRVNAIISLSEIECSSKTMSNNKIVIMNSQVIIQLRLHTRDKRSLWWPLTNQNGQWTIIHAEYFSNNTNQSNWSRTILITK